MNIIKILSMHTVIDIMGIAFLLTIENAQAVYILTNKASLYQ